MYNMYNSTPQILDYADYVNILEGTAHTIKEREETLIMTSKEIGVEVNIDKSKYMVIFRDRNAEQNQCMRTDDR